MVSLLAQPLYTVERSLRFLLKDDFCSADCWRPGISTILIIHHKPISSHPQANMSVAAPNSTVVSTYNLYGLERQTAYVGSVIDANPSATTLQLNCIPTDTGNACEVSNAIVTFGQWAQMTPPATASTGINDIVVGYVQDTATATVTMNCGMVSYTIPSTCTVTWASNPTLTGTVYTTINPNGTVTQSAAPVTVTITAGANKLSSASNATATTTGNSGTNTTGSANTTASAPVGHSNAAAGDFGVSMISVGIFALLWASFLV